MSITVEGLHEWMKDAKQGISFGFVEAPLSVPKYERALELMQLALGAQQHQRQHVYYIVPDRLSKVLLSKTCSSRAGISIMTTVDLFSQIDRLIEQGTRKNGNLAVIIEADHCASLEFCWSLIKFMLAAASLTPGQGRLIVIVVSDAKLLDAFTYIHFALTHISRGSQTWEIFEMAGRHYVADCTMINMHPSQVIDQAVEAVSTLETGEMIIFCGLDRQVDHIKERTAEKGALFLHPDMPERLLDTETSNNGVVIHLSGTNSIIAPLRGLKWIFCLRESQTRRFRSGHLITTKRLITQSEVDNLVAGHAHQAIGANAKQVIAVGVAQDNPGVAPLREYEHSQLYSFVWHFYAAQVPIRLQKQLLSILLLSDLKFREIARRLLHLGCLQRPQGEQSVGVSVNANDARTARLPRLLSALDQDLEAAWFLSNCLGGPMSDATPSVALLMVRLAVLKKNRMVLSRIMWPADDVKDNPKAQAQLLGSISNLSKGCSLPPATLSQGWLWPCVLLWQQAKLDGLLDAFRPRLFHKYPEFTVDISTFLRSLEAIETLDNIMAPGFPVRMQLQMNANERDQVMTEVAASWMYSCVLVRVVDNDAALGYDLVHFDKVNVRAIDKLDIRFVMPDDLPENLFLAVPLFFSMEGDDIVAWDIMSIPPASTLRMRLRFEEDDLQAVWQMSY